MSIGWCNNCKRPLINVDCDGGGICPYCNLDDISCKIPENYIFEKDMDRN